MIILNSPSCSETLAKLVNVANPRACSLMDQRSCHCILVLTSFITPCSHHLLPFLIPLPSLAFFLLTPSSRTLLTQDTSQLRFNPLLHLINGRACLANRRIRYQAPMAVCVDHLMTKSLQPCIYSKALKHSSVLTGPKKSIGSSCSKSCTFKNRNKHFNPVTAPAMALHISGH